jgi:hypothetical protein
MVDMVDDRPTDNDTPDPPPTLPERLQALLEMLFPDPPLVDILTLNDFTYRYPFSRLGSRAVKEIEQSQRITRGSGDYQQMGLSEFYAGLIYLHEGQFLGAAHYFIEARRFWTLGGRVTAVCLTHLAQGIAQQEAHHDEAALSRYGQADRCLRRFPLGDLLGRDAAFVAECRALLSECRETLAQRMRAQEEGDAAERPPNRLVLPGRQAAPAAEASTVAEAAPSATAEQPAPRQTISQPAAARPIFNLRAQPSSAALPVAGMEETRAEETAVVASPPIPGHQNNHPYLIWYKTSPKEGFVVQDWLPDIPANAYVLVDTRVDRYYYQPGNLVIVNSERAQGQIPVHLDPPSAPPSPEPIFLGELEKPPPEVSSGQVIADSGSVKLSPDQETPLYGDELIGIVIGVWVAVALQQRPAA